jgi:hypothetical protein
VSAHTPGPWTVLPPESGTDDYLRVRGTRLGGRYKIANVLSAVPLGANPIEAEEASANARLIAAAPELLEALRAAQELIERRWGYPDDASSREVTLEQTRAAIRKATEA